MEPERRIEKWLRAFAKKRREQAGPMELHPAARQQLQREIARRADGKDRGGFFSAFFSSLRLRVAFAVCFIALAAGVWFLLPEFGRQEPASLSMNNLGAAKLPKDEAARGAPAPPAANAPAPPATPPPVTITAVSSADKKIQVQTAPSVAPAPRPTAPTITTLKRDIVTPPSETREQADLAKGTFAKQEVTITTAAASAPATPAAGTNNTRMFAFKNETAADSIAAAGTLNKDAEGSLQSAAISQATNFATGATFADNQKTIRSDATVQAAANLGSNTALYDAQTTALALTAPTTSQMFNRSEPAATRQRVARTAGTPTPVLTQFRVEQSGNNMKVVDADGSVYTGSVQIATQQQLAIDSFSTASKSASTGGTIPAARRAAPAQSQAQSQQNYSFRVAGTNRALNQNIIFSGNFVPLTNSQLAGIAPGANGAGNAGGVGGFGGIRAGAFGGAPPAGSVNNSTAAPALDTPLLNSGINGTVTIGDQKAIDVIATPAH